MELEEWVSGGITENSDNRGSDNIGYGFTEDFTVTEMACHSSAASCVCLVMEILPPNIPSTTHTQHLVKINTSYFNLFKQNSGMKNSIQKQVKTVVPYYLRWDINIWSHN